MTQSRIISHEALKKEMKAVASGVQKAPADASRPSFNSIEALIRLLTSENRQLLATIRDEKPESIAKLAQLTGRAPPNLSRTLAKLEAAGLVKMMIVKKCKVPTAPVHVLRVNIDPYSDRDTVEIA